MVLRVGGWVWLVGKEIGESGPYGGAADAVGTGERGDGGALSLVCGPGFFTLVGVEGGWAAAVAAFGLGCGDPFIGEFVLQVALELADGADHIDDQVCGGVVAARFWKSDSGPDRTVG
nr:hypothetical protein [Nonomuraea montanisoli]